MFSPLLLILIAINVLLFLYSASSMENKAAMFSKYAVIPAAIRKGELYRLITSAFFHNDVFHIFLNMYSLYVLFPTVMVILGTIFSVRLESILFLVLYFFSSIIAGLVSAGRRNDMVPSIGASGAIFGLLGFLLSIGLLTFGSGGAALVQNILFVLVINFAIGLMPGLNIDNRGHFGGLIGGIIFGILSFAFVFLTKGAF